MSGLDRIIDPEINSNTYSYNFLKNYLKKVNVKSIIEIGASSGNGTTEALINGVLESNNKDIKIASIEISKTRFEILKNNYKDYKFFTPYNMSSLPISRFPSYDSVAKFISETRIHGGDVLEVLRWLKQDIDYINDNNIQQNGIEKIKEDLKDYLNDEDSFSLAIIDGSEFLGNEEYKELQNCDGYLLDDIFAYKNYFSHNELLNDKNYKLIYIDKSRGGTSFFTKKEIYDEYFK